MLLANVLRHVTLEASLLAPDFPSFKRQELTFLLLSQLLLTFLILANVLLPTYFGQPPLGQLIVLGVAFCFNIFEWFWLRTKTALAPRQIVGLTWLTILLHLSLAFALATLSYRQDIQYFALMIIPIFQAAFRLPSRATLATLALANGLIFYWVWSYFRWHPPVEVNEYIEAATIALIYSATALLVHALVRQLRTKQVSLSRSLVELEEAKAKLLIEEKLAAVGRFSSAIAHEIRNPVAMISSALATGLSEGLPADERAEMFDIAAKEASRLERLTTDFLAYAKPRVPAKQRADVADSIAYIADICRPRAAERSIEIRAEISAGLWSDVDAGQLQQALLNLAVNGIEASSPKGLVVLRGFQAPSGEVQLEIENSNGPIPASQVDCIFEPFFTTKAGGTGLGLAIARSIVRAQGGDLFLARNESGMVQFRIVLPASQSAFTQTEVS